MAQFDIHTRLSGITAMKQETIVSDTTTVGNIIDMNGFESAEFFLFSGAIATGVFTPLLEEGDSATLTDAATVPTEYVLGTYAAATFTTAAADDDAVKQIGYVGKKRYVRLSIVSTSTAAGIIGAVAVKGNPASASIDAAT